MFAAFSSIGIGDGVKFVIKNGKKSIIGITLTSLFCQTDAGAGLKKDLTGLGQDYITYYGYDQMSKGELALSLTMDLIFGAKSGYDDLNIKKKKVDVDDFVPDNATSRLDKIDGDDLVPDNSPITKGYYQDKTGRWHRPNGQFASNAEVGITPIKSINSNSTSTAGCPNPYGKKGGLAHQKVVEDIKLDAGRRGLSYDIEYKFDTSGGYKSSRYADVVVFDSKGRVMEIHQVGRTTKKHGAPVSRERKAIRDIRSSDDYNGAKIIYHPYDR